MGELDMSTATFPCPTDARVLVLGSEGVGKSGMYIEKVSLYSSREQFGQYSKRKVKLSTKTFHCV